MNKKGFTLIEVLAVIVILGVVMIIGTVSIAGVRNSINKAMFKTKLELAINTAKSWGQDHREDIINHSEQLTIGDLIDSNDLSTEEVAEYNECEDQSKKSACPVILDHNKNVANKLVINIYIQYNRVYACLLKNDYNQSFLGDDSAWNELYCD